MMIKHYVLERAWNPEYWMVSRPIAADDIGDPREVAIPAAVVAGHLIAARYPEIAHLINDPTATEIWIQNEIEDK